MRGILTAVSWIYPRNARFRSIACESFAEALVLAGEYRSTATAPLRAMERSLRAGLKTTPHVA